MKTLKHTKVIRIDEEMLQTFKNMKLLNVDVGKFIRNAINDKLDKGYKPKEVEDNFSNQLKKAILKNKLKYIFLLTFYLLFLINN